MEREWERVGESGRPRERGGERGRPREREGERFVGVRSSVVSYVLPPYKPQ